MTVGVLYWRCEDCGAYRVAGVNETGILPDSYCECNRKPWWRNVQLSDCKNRDGMPVPVSIKETALLIWHEEAA